MVVMNVDNWITSGVCRGRVGLGRFLIFGIMEELKELCGDLGGYEADFLYICTYLASLEGPLKSPAWTFVGLRSALESPRYDSLLKNIMRRCFVLASRNIIGGVDDENDSRMDRAIHRLIMDRPIEASILFPGTILPELESVGFLGLSYNQRARVVRFIMQTSFESPNIALQGAEVSGSPIVGTDADGTRYFLVKDSTLEVGCWKEVDQFGSVELIATTTDGLLNVSNTLRSSSSYPGRTKDTCVYCRKRTQSGIESQLCAGCSVGKSHGKCVPSSELNGLPWCCTRECKQLALSNFLRDFANEIEPQQKAAARKKRRIASELSSLQISAKDYGTTDTRRRSTTTTRGGRQSSSVDYSFRDYDKAISDAIRKSERKSMSETYSSEEDTAYKQASRSLSRDERMALRNQRLPVLDNPVLVENEEMMNSIDYTDPPLSEQLHDLSASQTASPDYDHDGVTDMVVEVNPGQMQSPYRHEDVVLDHSASEVNSTNSLEHGIDPQNHLEDPNPSFRTY